MSLAFRLQRLGTNFDVSSTIAFLSMDGEAVKKNKKEIALNALQRN